MKNNQITGEDFRTCLIAATNYLEANKEMVNNMNVFPVPDGDTGTNMSLTMKSAVKQVQQHPDSSVSALAKACATGALMGARGNSGVILSQLLRGVASALADKEVIEISDVTAMLDSAAKTAYKAVMKPTEGTILTVARCMGEFAKENQDKYTDILGFIKAVLYEGEAVLMKTPEMLPVLKEAGVVDAGGRGLLVLIEGAVHRLENGSDPVASPVETINVTAQIETAHASNLEASIQFGYCTEFLIHTKFGDGEKLRDQIAEMGDSQVVVQDGELIKVHIHTNHPGEILEKAMTLGDLSGIKIDNMRLQNETLKQAQKTPPAKKKPYGFISVSSGDGLKQVFEDLGVDVIIEGGQTMNPSTEDILKAIDGIAADAIFVLPNNGNIILTAQQAQAMSKKRVHVIPTKTIPQGFTSILAFDENAKEEDNAKQMTDAIGDVQTCQITFAVRDTKVNDLDIKEKDIIGLANGKIVASGKDIEGVTVDLVTKTVEEDSSLITIFYGEGVSEESAQSLHQQLEQKYEDYDIELVYGGQPIYYYLISIE